MKQEICEKVEQILRELRLKLTSKTVHCFENLESTSESEIFLSQLPQGVSSALQSEIEGLLANLLNQPKTDIQMQIS